MNGPGNDICADTNLTAAGCQLILFTTGRGTPLGGPAPTLKVATNSSLATRKPHWIDFDAGRLLTGTDLPTLAEALFDQVLAVAGGERTQNELYGYRQIAIFKDGVTM
jgi:altronate hydrolase